MANRKRDKLLTFHVTEEERKLIRKKMLLSHTRNMSAYLRKMAMDGYIINTDMTPAKKVAEELHHIGVNVNQITKIANTTGTVTDAELDNLKMQLADCWKMVRELQLMLK